ncbi:Nn.00g058430.m01.CDS01 [Neocucurbitaria sp. VM-36]
MEDIHDEEPIKTDEALAPRYPIYVVLPFWRELANIAEEKGLHISAFIRNLPNNAGHDDDQTSILIEDEIEQKKWSDGADKLLGAFAGGELGNREEMTKRIVDATKDKPIAPGPSLSILPVWPKEIHQDTKAERASREVFNWWSNGIIRAPALPSRGLALQTSDVDSLRRWKMYDCGDNTRCIKNADIWHAAIPDGLSPKGREYFTIPRLAEIYGRYRDKLRAKAKEPKPQYPDVVEDWVLKLRAFLIDREANAADRAGDDRNMDLDEDNEPGKESNMNDDEDSNMDNGEESNMDNGDESEISVPCVDSDEGMEPEKSEEMDEEMDQGMIEEEHGLENSPFFRTASPDIDESEFQKWWHSQPRRYG